MKEVYITQKNNKSVYITPGFLLLLTAVTLLSGLRLAAVTALAAAVHECGHLLAIRLLGGHMESLRLTGGGAELRIRSDMSYYGDAVTALAGPLASWILTGACLYFGDGAGREWVIDTASVSALYGLINLIPARPLDGGRALNALICRFFGPTAADIAGKVLDALCVTAAFAGGIYVAVYTNGNITALICAFFLLSACCKAKAFGV